MTKYCKLLLILFVCIAKCHQKQNNVIRFEIQSSSPTHEDFAIFFSFFLEWDWARYYYYFLEFPLNRTHIKWTKSQHITSFHWMVSSTSSTSSASSCPHHNMSRWQDNFPSSASSTYCLHGHSNSPTLQIAFLPRTVSVLCTIRRLKFAKLQYLPASGGCSIIMSMISSAA